MCDSILLSKSATSNTVAISGLHVIKAHPEYLKKYIYSYSKTFINLFFYILKGIYFYCTYFIKNFFTKKVRYLNTKKKIIIISHLLSPHQIKKEKDLYFGDLQKVLVRKKIDIQKIFINHTKISTNKLNNSIWKEITSQIYNDYNIKLKQFYIFLSEIDFYCSGAKVSIKNG